MPLPPLAAGIIAMPELLCAALEEGGIKEVERWWREELDADGRSHILKLWGDCADLYLGPGRIVDLPMEMRVRGTRVKEEVETFEGFWNQEFYDYLVNHEAYYFEEEMVHVCTAELAARRAIESGVLAADFKCGIPVESCPIRRRVEEAGGCGIRLSLWFVPKAG